VIVNRDVLSRCARLSGVRPQYKRSGFPYRVTAIPDAISHLIARRRLPKENNASGPSKRTARRYSKAVCLTLVQVTPKKDSPDSGGISS
jgi:hypothetical protein